RENHPVRWKMQMARRRAREREKRSTLTRLWPDPVRIVVERKYLLNPFRTVVFLVPEHLQRLTNFGQPWVIIDRAGVPGAADAIEDGGEIEQFRAGFEKVTVQGLVGGQRRDLHGLPSHGLAKRRLRLTSTKSFRLPERNPCKSSAMNWNPISRKCRTSS